MNLAVALVGAAIAVSNPVLDHDFPDPTVIHADDGVYYAYGTQGYGEHDGHLDNIQLARSSDLATWTHLGDALPSKPAWASSTQKFWAPHVSKIGMRYVMYFSAEPDSGGKTGLCLGLATSLKPSGPFQPEAKPLLCGKGFENIDPMFFHDPRSGKNYLYWGSGFGPLRAREMTADGLDFQKGSGEIDLLSPMSGTVGGYQRLVEGAWIEYRAPNYYLFFSGDNCCNPNPHYAVLVAQSRDALGPFTVIGPLVESFDRFIATGHNSVIDSDDGKSWIFFHAIDTQKPQLSKVIPGDRDVRRVLMRLPIEWNPKGPTVLH